MKILITGGAGYIGSHAVFRACQAGYQVVVVDNLFHGYQDCITVLTKHFPGQIIFYKADLRDKQELSRIVLAEKHIDGVMHFAALCLVNESMQDPYLYFSNNTYGTANLLQVMKESEIKNIVFSSTCATYAPVTVDSTISNMLVKNGVNELYPQIPESPYGESKYMSEKEILWYKNLFDINYTILRYFNVCGAQKDGIIGDSKKPSQLLMQNAVRGALGIEPFQFTCSRVDTPDGSPIRDYVNVEDLVEAHFLAFHRMMEKNLSGIYNIGTGIGNSVKEIVDQVMKVTGKSFAVTQGEPRRGEATALFADISKAKSELGWVPTRTIEDSINSLVNWYKDHPSGWQN